MLAGPAAEVNTAPMTLSAIHPLTGIPRVPPTAIVTSVGTYCETNCWLPESSRRTSLGGRRRRLSRSRFWVVERDVCVPTVHPETSRDVRRRGSLQAAGSSPAGASDSAAELMQ
jgi:hypothetical protein